MQDKVAAFVAARRLGTDAQVRYIDLNSEIGELGKALLTATAYGEAPLTLTDNLREELGDCLFSLLALCDALGIRAEDALSRALDKYSDRFTRHGKIDSGR